MYKERKAIKGYKLNQEVIRKRFTVKARAFNGIYSEGVSPFFRIFNRLFRWDIIARMESAFERLIKDDVHDVLDVGCGTGRLSLELAKKGKRVWGLDFSTKMIEIAEELRKKNRVENIRFICKDILSYSPRKQVDAAVALGFFDYTADPAVYLRKFTILTRKLLIATFPRKKTLRAVLRKIRLGLLGCPVYFYNFYQIKKLLEETGFNIVRHTIIGQLHYIEAQKK